MDTYVCLLNIECDQFNAETYEVFIRNGTTTRTISINITNDDIYEGDESFTLQIDSSLPDLVTLGQQNTATVVIQEDEKRKYLFCFNYIPYILGYLNMILDYLCLSCAKFFL